VPLVNNLPVARAEQDITAAHLGYTVVDQANSTVQKGYVISSSPPEGNNVTANTTVTLYVSTGAKQVAVPNVVGQQESDAENALQQKGFQFTIKSDPSSSAPTGQVVQESPPGGSMQAPNTTITLTVSGGIVSVPSVVGDSQQTASSILTTAGFTVSVQQGSGPAQYANGTVFNQVPAANGNAAKGSTVTIYVQNGASPTPSPTPSLTPTPTGSTPGGPGGF
jgi:beta-lactam-binding protein with PASTA domain